MSFDSNIKKSIEELEKDYWGKPEFDSSVVTKSHELRCIPINELACEEIRFLLGQNIGVKWLFDVALSKLVEDPLVEGDNYPGDLLCSLLRVNKSYWHENPESIQLVERVVDCALNIVSCNENFDLDEKEDILLYLNESVKFFKIQTARN